jgi:hypothetical protein
MFKCINSFNQVELLPNSLLVFDIDETIMSFEDIDEGWWKKTFDKYYEQTQDYDMADELSLREWVDHISNSKPKVLDEFNFIFLVELAKQNDCEIIMLTARRKFLFDITISHLAHCKVDIDSDSVYFNENKGTELLNIVTNKYPNISNIIFIDDIEHNLINVANTFAPYNKYTLDLYKINHHTTKTDSDEPLEG